jgi:hypothetical protein
LAFANLSGDGRQYWVHHIWLSALHQNEETEYSPAVINGLSSCDTIVV